MATKRKLAGRNQRSVGKYPFLDKTRTNLPHNHQRETRKANRTPSCEFSSGDFIRRADRAFNVVETAKITRQDVWWNYAEQSDLMALYQKTMLNSGKHLKQFTLEKLVRFIEENREIDHLFLSNLFEGSGVDLAESNAEITYDSMLEKVVYSLSMVMYPAHQMEDPTTLVQIKGLKDKKLVQYRKMRSVLISKVFELAHVYNNQLHTNLEYSDFFHDEYEDYDGGLDDIEIKERKADFKKGIKALGTKAYQQRVKEYQPWFAMDEKILAEKVYQLMPEIGFSQEEIDEFREVISTEMMHPFITNTSAYGNCLNPMATCFVTDDYASSLDIARLYQLVVESESNDMGIDNLHWELNLMEESISDFIERVTKIYKWL